jgi:hypothetical protein
MRPSIDACIDPVAWVSSLAGSPALSSVGLSARQCCERRAPYARRGGKGASCSGAMIEQVRPRAAYDTIGPGYGSVRRPDPCIARDLGPR